MRPLSRSADVLVVGGGPAGSVFARQLSRLGQDVCILDRDVFPRPKPCGESLNPGAVDVLARLGLLPAVLATEPAEMNEWHISDVRGPDAVGAFSGRGALGITRETFDDTLLNAARDSGTRVFERHRVIHLKRRASGWAATARGPEGAEPEWEARVIVGADGLRSIVSRQLGLIARKPKTRKTSMTFRVRGTGPTRHRGRMMFSGHMTVGLAPVNARQPLWNCTVVVPSGAPARRLASQPEDIVRNALSHFPLPWEQGPDIVDGPWASGPFDWPNRCAVTDSAMLIGDAAGYFDPLTGQGIYRALRSAELAAGVLHRALQINDVSCRQLLPYHRQFKRELFAPRLFQRVVDAVLQPPTVRAHALRALARSSPLANRIVEVAGDVRSVTSLVHPDLLFRRIR